MSVHSWFQKFILASAFVLVLALCHNAGAIVFMRMPKDAQTVLETAGGTRAYTSAVKINGNDGKIHVYGFAENLADLSASLAKRIGVTPSSGDMLRLPADYQGATLVMIPGADAATSGTSVILIEPDAATKTKTETVEPPAWPFAQFPKPDFLAVGFTVESTETATTMCTASAPIPDYAAMSVMTRILARNGWTLATPAGKNATIALFARDTDIFMVCAVARDTGCGLLLMQKSGTK